jgi:hypothetical protein
MDIIDIYNNYIQNRFNDLIISKKEIDNYDLSKIFEYYSCVQLSKKYNQIFYEYDNIDPTFKENNKMSRNDTGIDACNLVDTIVQCKLRKTTIIQIIGRALRLYTTKTFANIILPFTSKEDESNISRFLKILAHNDTRIRKSYESKKEGGYISIEKIKNNEDDTNENKDIEFRYDMIYDSMGILQNGEDIWMKKIEWVMKYIDDNKKRPSSEDINKEIKAYGQWASQQKNYYIKNESIMKNEVIRNKWNIFINDNKYKQYFISNDDRWINTLEIIKKYIEDEKKLPTKYNKNKEIKQLGKWLSTQQQNYSKKEHLMIDKLIREKWELFINENKKYYLLNQKHAVKNKK